MTCKTLENSAEVSFVFSLFSYMCLWNDGAGESDLGFSFCFSSYTCSWIHSATLHIKLWLVSSQYSLYHELATFSDDLQKLRISERSLFSFLCFPIYTVEDLHHSPGLGFSPLFPAVLYMLEAVVVVEMMCLAALFLLCFSFVIYAW